jgi:hypothetical protein
MHWWPRNTKSPHGTPEIPMCRVPKEWVSPFRWSVAKTLSPWWVTWRIHLTAAFCPKQVVAIIHPVNRENYNNPIDLGAPNFQTCMFWKNGGKKIPNRDPTIRDCISIPPQISEFAKWLPSDDKAVISSNQHASGWMTLVLLRPCEKAWQKCIGRDSQSFSRLRFLQFHLPWKPGEKNPKTRSKFLSRRFLGLFKVQNLVGHPGKSNAGNVIFYSAGCIPPQNKNGYLQVIWHSHWTWSI